MERGVLTLSVAVLLAGVPNTAKAASPTELVVPEGGLVLDGGDMEAARALQGSRRDLALADGMAKTTSLAASTAAALFESQATGGSQTPPSRRPVAFEYSEGYQTRLKIHKYASYATLPLFVAQFAVGQKLYNGNGSDGTRTAHGILAGGTAVLFGLNTVTGVWNLSEGRKDPSHHTKRMVHGILMAVADAGFLATGIMTPHHREHEEGGFTFVENGGTSPSTHRAVALTSMGIATVAYLMMLIH
jgi:hypothetical protein